MPNVKKPESMSREELICLTKDLKNTLEHKEKALTSYRTIKDRSFDIGLGATIPLKTSKLKSTSGMISFRESDQWIYCAERFAEITPSGMYKTKGQICRAAYRVGLFVQCLLYEKAIEEGDIHIGYKFPDPMERVFKIKNYMTKLQDVWWSINTQLIEEEYAYRRDIAKNLKNPISMINELNELEKEHVELFRPSYEIDIGNIKIIDEALNVANKLEKKE